MKKYFSKDMIQLIGGAIVIVAAVYFSDKSKESIKKISYDHTNTIPSRIYQIRPNPPAYPTNLQIQSFQNYPSRQNKESNLVKNLQGSF